MVDIHKYVHTETEVLKCAVKLIPEYVPIVLRILLAIVLGTGQMESRFFLSFVFNLCRYLFEWLPSCATEFHTHGFQFQLTILVFHVSKSKIRFLSDEFIFPDN